MYIDQLNDTVINYDLKHDLNENIKSILAINENIIWFCSDNGIHEYSRLTNEFSLLSKKDGLPGNFIMNAVMDLNGVVWVGTTDGLAYYKDGRFVEVNHSNVSSAKFITFLKVDENNNLWIGTNQGLFQLQIDDYNQFLQSDFKYYSKFRWIERIRV